MQVKMALQFSACNLYTVSLPQPMHSPVDIVLCLVGSPGDDRLCQKTGGASTGQLSGGYVDSRIDLILAFVPVSLLISLQVKRSTPSTSHDDEYVHIHVDIALPDSSSPIY